MSSPQIRRADRAMSVERTLETLAQGYSGRLATVSEDGFPYCIPLLYLWIDGEVLPARHERRRTFRANSRETLAFASRSNARKASLTMAGLNAIGAHLRSVCLFGRIRSRRRPGNQAAVLRTLDGKIPGKPETNRPKGSFPADRCHHRLCHFGLSASPARKPRCRRFPNSGLRRTGRRTPGCSGPRTVTHCPQRGALQNS